MEHIETLSHSQTRTLAANRLIRNTYTLLALTLAFSAVMAGVSMSFQLPFFNPIVFLLVYFGLLFLTTKFRNSGMGIVCVFALTGFLGMTLGPILSFYLATPHGSQLVMQALGATAFIFFALSAYALISRKDFSFMGGFLFVGVLVAFLAGLAALFFNLPTLSLAVSAAFVLLSSGIILYQTSAIVNGGETNYIMATVTLYVSLYNLFLSLLRLLSVFSGDD
ncbi:MAG: Bax inhibitor-1/YccA family protein [Proteobacteria bacterium]|jgi:modulator of FtsH protease|nr:Bax inhibitor-1/YccA family protein [Pseudomonadota bacterium]